MRICILGSEKVRGSAWNRNKQIHSYNNEYNNYSSINNIVYYDKHSNAKWLTQ